jgi:5'-3' exonuclease
MHIVGYTKEVNNIVTWISLFLVDIFVSCWFLRLNYRCNERSFLGSAYACSFDLCERGQNAITMQPCINYCMHRINLLRFHNIIPVVVFDGGRLPFKGTTETERQK